MAPLSPSGTGGRARAGAGAARGQAVSAGRYPALGSSASSSREAICRREEMPSFRNTLLRWNSTVETVMNSREAISALVLPCAARTATCRSCGVRSPGTGRVRLRTCSPVASSSARARPANGTAPRVENLVRGAQVRARFSAPPAAAEPFPEQKAGPREVQGGRPLAEQLDRFPIAVLSLLVGAHQGLAAGQEAEAPE